MPKLYILDYASFVFSGPEELGSGSYGHRYITDTGNGDDDGIDIDDSDYDIYIDEVNLEACLWHFKVFCVVFIQGDLKKIGHKYINYMLALVTHTKSRCMYYFACSWC